jgi:hypothetical protein
VVECTRLEIWRTFRRTVSSNLTLSASTIKPFKINNLEGFKK